MIRFSANDKFLVTGASSGIGRAVAHLIVRLNGKVVAVGRDRARLQDTVSSAKEPRRMAYEIRDLAEDLDQLPVWLWETIEKHGPLKGLALCAGVQQVLPLRATQMDQAKQLFDINYFANMALMRGFLRKKVRASGATAIVLVSSITAIKGQAGLVQYSASKGAINSAVGAMAAEVARDSIRVNAVLPGWVDTSMMQQWAKQQPGLYEEIQKQYPLGIGKPEDVASAVVFLLSEQAKWITGTSLVIDGGACA